MTSIIWLSDLHYMVDGDINGHDPRARLSRTVSLITQEYGSADAVIVTGDLTEHGRNEDYRELAAVLETLPMPVLAMNGNHDDRAAMARHLPPPIGAMPGYRQFAEAFGDTVVLGLDTYDGLAEPGTLCADRLDWLRDALAGHAGARLLVGMHHPPVALGLPNQDHDRVRQGETLMRMLADHDGEVHVLCGHVHRSVQTVAYGVPVTAARSVAYQAPALRPLWNWDNFEPAAEAPTMGVIERVENGFSIHNQEICPHDFGVTR